MPLDEPEWWYGKDGGWRARLLAPAGAVYGWVAERRWRNRAPYRSRLPVICVGNFTAGGTGKTPLALLIARELAAIGEKPVFLTRGYGGRMRGPHWGDPQSDTPRDVGDEPLLLAHEAPTAVTSRHADAARLRERQEPIERGLLEERIAAGEHHAVEVGLAREPLADVGVVDADADRTDHALCLEVDERAPRTGERLALAGRGRLAVRPGVDVVDERDVERGDAQAQHRLLDRAHRAVVRVVEAALVRQAAGVTLGAQHAAGSGSEDAANLRRQHDGDIRPPAQRGADPVFGEPAAVERRSVDERDARIQRGEHGGDRGIVVERRVQVAQRGAAEAQRRDGRAAGAERSGRERGRGLRCHRVQANISA